METVSQRIDHDFIRSELKIRAYLVHRVVNSTDVEFAVNKPWINFIAHTDLTGANLSQDGL